MKRSFSLGLVVSVSALVLAGPQLLVSADGPDWDWQATWATDALGNVTGVLDFSSEYWFECPEGSPMEEVSSSTGTSSVVVGKVRVHRVESATATVELEHHENALSTTTTWACEDGVQVSIGSLAPPPELGATGCLVTTASNCHVDCPDSGTQADTYLNSVVLVGANVVLRVYCDHPIAPYADVICTQEQIIDPCDLGDHHRTLPTPGNNCQVRDGIPIVAYCRVVPG